MRRATLTGYVADPRKLAAGYLNVALRRGARLHAPLDVISFVEEARRPV